MDEPTRRRECFFTEAAFLRVMGSGPPLEERLRSLASRPKTEYRKDKIKLQFDRSLLGSSLEQPTITRKSKRQQNPSKRLVDQSVEIQKDVCDMSSCEENMELIDEFDNTNIITPEDQTGHRNSDVLEIYSLAGDQDDQQDSEKSDSEICQRTVDCCDDKSSNKVTETVAAGDVKEESSSSKSTASSELHAVLDEKGSPDNACLNLVRDHHDNQEEEYNKGSVDSEINSTGQKSAELTPGVDTPASPDPPEEVEEELCCLLMKSQSSDDDENSDEDKKETNKVSCQVETNKVSCQVESETDDRLSEMKTQTSKQTSENSFALVMPKDTSSDEHSSKEDISNFYSLHSLDSAQPAKSATPATSPSGISNKNGLEAGSFSSLSDKQSMLPNQGRGEQVSENARNVSISVSKQFTIGDKSASPVKPQELNTKNGRNNSYTSDGNTSVDTSSDVGGKNQEMKQRIFQDLRSKLNKKDHRRYIQLYKKHVCPMMKGNRKTAYTEPELRELVELEELQQRVSQEQVLYQDYLKDRANRNPNAYNYLQNVPRIYAHSRYNSYHRPRNFIRNFDNNGIMDIPIVLEDKTSSTLMNFKKILLKLGSSPGITLPDVKDGANPVPIKLEPSAVMSLFPSSSGLSNIHTVDHKMISEDGNARLLAEQEKADVVLSSSSLKCLMDNHGSDVMKPWNIPVVIRSKCGHKTVYLDKPLYKDDVLIRDYNALYHKYALRTLVSRPRRQKNKAEEPNKVRLNPGGQQNKMTSIRRENSFAADDFDMFSTDTPCEIETFGTFSQKRTRSWSSSSHSAENFDLSSKKGENKSADDGAINEVTARITRSRGKVEHGNTEMDPNISDTSTDKPVMQESTDKSNSSETLEPGNDKTERSLRSRTRLSESMQVSKSTVLTEEPPLKVAKIESNISTTSDCETSSVLHNAKLQGRSGKGESLLGLSSSPQQVTAASKEGIASHSSGGFFSSGGLNPKVALETKSLAGREAPTFKFPGSHVRGDISFNQNKTQANLLDSILGPSGCPKQKPNTDRDLKYGFSEGNLPIAETCNTVTYNLWELGSLRMILRCNGHGTLKDKAKPRYIYLSPKMEYQPDAGMEQVTLSEMTRAWTACFIRPTTNFVRVRIHAFTSEILMIEELTTDKILNPSLPFKPDHSLDVIRRLLEQLRSLPEGQYLLSHFKGHKVCSVRKFHGKSSLMAGPRKKKSGRAKVGQVPWIPIDPTILIPSHIQNNRIPATFMPSDWESSSNNTQNKGKGNRRQTKKGKWKGQQQQK